jgi:hypothetical protein
MYDPEFWSLPELVQLNLQFVFVPDIVRIAESDKLPGTDCQSTVSGRR